MLCKIIILNKTYSKKLNKEAVESFWDWDFHGIKDDNVALGFDVL